jgi:hypothetical protein
MVYYHDNYIFSVMRCAILTLVGIAFFFVREGGGTLFTV